MASRRTAAIALLLLRVVPLWASSLEHSVDPELLQDACVAGSEACGADVLSLRQLRGEPVRETVAIEDQGDSAEQSETAAGTGASLKALSGQGWPAWVVGADTSVSGWAWDIVRVKFLTITGEEVSPSTPGCHLVQSGTVDTPGYSALNAFSDDSSWWGGRKDHAHNMFYLGITCNWHVQVAAVQLQQLDGDHSAHEAMLYHSHWDHHTALATTQLATGRLQTIWEGVFGVRLVAADLRSGWAWDVRRLKVVVPSDYSVGFSGGELATDHAHPYFCHAVDSGSAGHTYDVANAFHDGHSWWGGRPDSTGKFFLGVECDQPFTWPGMDNIWFDQIDHVHYAHVVDVEVSTAFGWKVKGSVHVAADRLAPLRNCLTAGKEVDLSGARDFRITARINTKADLGTIFGKAFQYGLWRNGNPTGQGKMLFLRGGRLCFDIGWVGAVCGRTVLNDGRDHEVGVEFAEGKYHVLVAGAREGSGLQAVPDHPETTLSIGESIGHHVSWTKANGDMAPDFVGTIEDLCFA